MSAEELESRREEAIANKRPPGYDRRCRDIRPDQFDTAADYEDFVGRDPVVRMRMPERDYTWDPVWQERTSITPTGWIVEIRIPFSQLRFTAAGSQRSGI